MLNALLLLAATAHGSCDEAPQFVQAAEQAILEERLDQASEFLKNAEVAFSCGPLVEPALLNRYWLAEGALRTRLGDTRQAGLSFAAAARLVPGHWPLDYGIKSYVQFMAASEHWLRESSLRLHPEPEQRLTALDGAETEFPAVVLEGLHLVQVGADLRAVEFASFVLVSADEPFLVMTGLEPLARAMAQVEAEEQAQEPATRHQRRHHPAFLVAGGVTAALAGGAALAARSQDGAMEDATSVDQLNTAYERQQIYNNSIYYLLGGTALGVGLFLVF